MTDVAEVAVINRALALLGQEPVSDLGESSLQRSLSATKLARHMADARDTVLRRHGWLCALEYKTLTPATLSGYANWRYPSVYQLPGNALRVWEIEGVTANGREPGCWEPRWQLGTVDTEAGGAQLIIRAREADAALNVAYVRRANWAALDAHVTDAVAHEVASRGAYQVTGDLGKAQKIAQAAEQKVLLAISVDATQEGGQPPPAASIPAAIRACAR